VEIPQLEPAHMLISSMQEHHRHEDYSSLSLIFLAHFRDSSFPFDRQATFPSFTVTPYLTGGESLSQSSRRRCRLLRCR